MTQLTVGVDTGGTRTTVSVRERGVEEPLHTYQTIDALSGSLPSHCYPDTLRKILAQLDGRWMTLAPPDAEVAVFVSSAGFAPSTQPLFSDAFADVLPSVLGGQVQVCAAANDTVSLLLGCRADVAVIAGTGSNVMARKRDGKIKQIAGHGWAACDYGAGFWIGLRGIRESYKNFEHGEDTAILQRLYETYTVRGHSSIMREKALIARLREFSVSDENMKPEIAKFAYAMCEAATRGDLVAQDIVKSEAEALADMTAVLMRRSFSTFELSGEIEALLCGGLFKSEFYRSAFETQVDLRLGRPASGEERSWTRVETGVEASLAIAERLFDGRDHFSDLEPTYRPFVFHP